MKTKKTENTDIDFTITPEDRIIQAKIALTDRMPFFSYIIMNFKLQEKPEVLTMGISRFGTLYWAPDFVKTINFEELLGCMCHEAGHIALMTFEREGSRNRTLWNYATDLTINWIIQESKLSLPKTVLLCNKDGIHELTDMEGKKHKIIVIGRSSEEIYDDLEKIIKNNIQNLAKNFDQHFDEGDANGSNGNDKPSDSEIAENKEKWEKRISEAAVVNQNKNRGSLPGELGRFLDVMLNPQINWKKKLMAFTTREFPSDYTLSRPGRRYYTTQVYFPTVLKENLNINVGIDCSGSIGQQEYDKFISEVLSIARGFDQIKMYVQYWDTSVKSELEVINGNINKIKEYRVSNVGGGTTISSWKKYLDEKNRRSSIHVCFTDGHVEGDLTRDDFPSGKLIFVIQKGGNKTYMEQFGEVAMID